MEYAGSVDQKGMEKGMKGSKDGFFRKIWNVLMPLLLYLGGYVASLYLLSRLLQTVAGGGSLIEEHMETVTGIVNGTGMLIGAALLLPMLQAELHESKEDCDSRPTVAVLLLTVMSALSSSIGLNILISLTSLVKNSASYQEVAQTQYGVAFGVGLFLYTVVSPLAEEIVFRGVVYNRMRRYLHEWQSTGRNSDCVGSRVQDGTVRGTGCRFDAATAMAVIASGVLFGIYHGNLVQGLYGSCMGILIAYMYERTHAFCVPVLFHGLANCAVYLMAQNSDLQEKIFTMPCCAALLAVTAVMLFIVEKLLSRGAGSVRS